MSKEENKELKKYKLILEHCMIDLKGQDERKVNVDTKTSYILIILVFLLGVILQNDIGNRHSPTVICAAITSKMNKAKLPTHVELDAKKYDLVKDSVVLLEQIRTIDKQRLKDKVCQLDHEIMKKVEKDLRISLELYT